ncbi:uncharacterized protein LOC112340566 [Selaginella moellendorffii]|uniref:uncharacterized protein LOC112340566 n=1 Tax=Selaginella moellendorffii TaxID=88036 RepID=UPI000D1CD72A|nr:uncharacterized protein LOC112340566 [Selaginella moellendorffii]|eukprot:XP_024515010.1 uncharacterized protein LOC112340566 [Selaginella moellendorffii]
MVCRKKNVSHGSGDGEDWTEEQEARLHNAHLAVRATPNFWRDIAKLVPGKTADECFHRFYSAHPTPPLAPQQHGRRVCLSSPIRPLEGKLLSPTRLLHQKQAAKIRKVGGRSTKAIFQSHKAVREILRKQQIDDQGYEEDAFAALESTDIPCWDKAAALVSIATPAATKRKKSAKKKEVIKAVVDSSSERPSSSEVLRPASTDGRKHERYLDLLIRRNKLPAASQRKNAKKDDPSSSGGGFGSKLKARLGSSKNLSTAKSAVIASARDVLEQIRERRSSSSTATKLDSDRDSGSCSDASDLDDF